MFGLSNDHICFGAGQLSKGKLVHRKRFQRGKKKVESEHTHRRMENIARARKWSLGGWRHKKDWMNARKRKKPKKERKKEKKKEKKCKSRLRVVTGVWWNAKIIRFSHTQTGPKRRGSKLYVFLYCVKNDAFRSMVGYVRNHVYTRSILKTCTHIVYRQKIYYLAKTSRFNRA